MNKCEVCVVSGLSWESLTLAPAKGAVWEHQSRGWAAWVDGRESGRAV